jgi:hypothetical protein
MIVGDLAKPLARIVLPEPLHSPTGPFLLSEGGYTVFYIGESRRLWRLDFGPEFAPIPKKTGIIVPDPTDFEPIDFIGDRAVFSCDDFLNVFVASTGRHLLKIPIKDSYGACLTPDGRNLIYFDSETTLIWPLNDEIPTPINTRLFHSSATDLPYFGYEPYSAARIRHPEESNGFHIVVGHYGFAVEYSVAYTNSAPAEFALDAKPRIHQPFVFDPVYVCIGGRYPLVALNHGYGAGIKLIDVKTGNLRSCPDVAEKTPTGYARYSLAFPSSDHQVLVKTIGGWILWDLTTDAALPLCSLAINPVHCREGGLWATKAEDPAALCHYEVKLQP